MPVLTIVPDVETHGFSHVRRLAASHPLAAITGPGMLLEEGALIQVAQEERIEIGGLSGGMVSGKPSVMICLPLPDGRVVLAETSLALFLAAADALKARYGDPR